MAGNVKKKKGSGGGGRVIDILRGTLISDTVFNDPNGDPYEPQEGKVYLDTTTGKYYRYDFESEIYTEVAVAIEIGEVTGTAYEGSKGKKNADDIAVLKTRMTTAEENVANLDETVSGTSTEKTVSYPFATVGKFDDDGAAVSGTYMTTGVCELPSGATSVEYYTTTYNVRGFFVYDDNMVCIAKSDAVSGSKVSSGTMDIPSGAKYVAAQVSNSASTIASAKCIVTYSEKEGGLVNDMKAIDEAVAEMEGAVSALGTGKVNKSGLGEVTPQNLQIVENVSRNLFEPNAIQNNKTVNDSTGEIINQSNIAISGIMAVTDALPLWSTSSGNIKVWAYSSDPSEGIQGYLGVAGNFRESNPVTLPTDTAYIIITKPGGDLSAYMCYQARDPLAEYEPYTIHKIIGDYLPAETARIAMPSTLYKLKDEPHMVFYDEVRDKNKPVFISQGGNGNNVTALYQTGKKWVFTQNANVSTLMARIFDDTEDHVLHQKLFNLKVSDPNTDNGQIVIHPIGDSFTDINQQYGWMNTNLPNLSFVGILKSPSGTGTGLYHDGRTGRSLQWMVNSYKESGTGSAAGVSEFMHPVSDTYKYYGTVEYWKYLMTAGSGGTVSPYAADTITRLGIGSNGYRSNPNVNDLMYDGTNFKVWDGTAWKTVSEETVGAFAFSYEKYLDVYEIDTPDIVCIQLGTNDWQGKIRQNDMTELREGFPVWMKTMVDGIHAVDADIKVLVIIPPKETMSEAYDIRDFAKSNINMMECREILVDNFDGLESENTYLVDAGATIDPYEDFGRRGENTSPEWARGLVSDGIHVNGDGFVKIGKAIGACVQYLRGEE